MNLAHHPSLQGRNASACHLSQCENQQAVKLTPLSSSRSPKWPICKRPSSKTTKPPAYPFIQPSMSKSRGTKITEDASINDAPTGHLFPMFCPVSEAEALSSVRGLKRQDRISTFFSGRPSGPGASSEALGPSLPGVAVRSVRGCLEAVPGRRNSENDARRQKTVTVLFRKRKSLSK